jgi:hypothetical protein
MPRSSSGSTLFERLLYRTYAVIHHSGFYKVTIGNYSWVYPLASLLLHCEHIYILPVISPSFLRPYEHSTVLYFPSVWMTRLMCERTSSDNTVSYSGDPTVTLGTTLWLSDLLVLFRGILPLTTLRNIPICSTTLLHIFALFCSLHSQTAPTQR